MEIYPDRAAANIFSRGFSKGFSLGYSGPRQALIGVNLISARQHPGMVRDKLTKEIQLGRVAGPFISPPWDHAGVPIGVSP